MNNKKYFLILLFLTIILAATAFLGILLGSVKIPAGEVILALVGKGSSAVNSLLIFNIRLPRMLAAILAGMGLACSGVILQGVMNNSLASPNTIGVNSGAGFAVMLGMMLLGGSSAYSPLFAFLGALVTTLLIFALAYFGDSSRTTIILAGITVSSFLSAGTNTIKLLDSDITLNITTFLIGTLSGVTMDAIRLPAACIIISVALAIMLSKYLNLLSLGDDIARSLGANVTLLRLVLLVLASVLAGCVVSFAGLLGFVGLIVPHMGRKMFGNDARLLMPCCALLGAILVTMCDMLARVVAAPYELPVGIILSFVGGPFFMYLLLRKKGGRRVNA
jgi:iron complex transport system permease protein